MTPVDDGNLSGTTKLGDQLTDLRLEIRRQGHLEGPGLIAHVSDPRCVFVGSCSQGEEVCADLDAIRVVESGTSALRLDLERNESILAARGQEIVGFAAKPELIVAEYQPCTDPYVRCDHTSCFRSAKGETGRPSKNEQDERNRERRGECAKSAD